MLRIVRRDRRTARAMPRRSPLTERDARRLHRDVGARAHRDADVGLRERRRIVDAVAGHRDDCAFRLQTLHDRGLVLRQHVGDDLVHAERVADGSRRALRRRPSA